MVMYSLKRHLGIEIAPNPCPKCGGKMFKIPCKCPFRRKGWALCAKCLNAACGYQMGLVKRGRRDRTNSLGGLSALSQ